MQWKAFDRLANGVVLISSVALTLLIVFTGWQVWGRYVLNDTPTWTEKAALLLILLVSLPMAAVGLRENFHLGIDFAVRPLPDKARLWIERTNCVILAVFGTYMIFGSWPLVKGTWGRDIPLIGVPQGIQYLPLIVAGVLIVAFMVERLWFSFRGVEPESTALSVDAPEMRQTD